MRDVIWTLIIIWLVFKLIDVFKSVSRKKAFVDTENDSGQNGYSNFKSNKKDIKKAVQNHLNNEGEYVDFEEV